MADVPEQLTPPSWWDYLDSTDAWLKEHENQLSAPFTPVPVEAFKSVRLALQQARLPADAPGRGRPRKECQHFWIACYYLVAMDPQANGTPKRAAVDTAVMASNHGVPMTPKSVQKVYGRMADPVNDFLDALLQTWMARPPPPEILARVADESPEQVGQRLMTALLEEFRERLERLRARQDRRRK
jgi:hypothetical protein